MLGELKSIFGDIFCIINGIKHGNNLHITPPIKLHCSKGTLTFGKNVSISSSCVILGVTNRAKIIISDNNRISHHFQISCANKVYINSDVNIGPFVFITDHNHKFEDPQIPIKDQGFDVKEDASVVIGEGCWIGTKVTIVGNVVIGKHCVIGANSVVTKDIPD